MDGQIRYKVGVAQLCFTYDETQIKLRRSDQPRTRHLLGIQRDYRGMIDSLVGEMMVRLVDGSIDDRSEASAELAYFNAWFARRGGWRDGTRS